MRGYTHMMAGVCIGLISAKDLQLGAIGSSIVVGASITGSLLPDVCHPSSNIGRKAGFVSKIIRSIFGHRTITHSLLFLLAVTFVSDTVFSNMYITKGLLLGMASHLVLDAFTAQGIQLFYPLHTKVRSPIHTRTGSFVEHLLCFAFMIISCFVGYEILLRL